MITEDLSAAVLLLAIDVRSARGREVPFRTDTSRRFGETWEAAVIFARLVSWSVEAAHIRLLTTYGVGRSKPGPGKTGAIVDCIRAMCFSVVSTTSPAPMVNRIPS